jgi:hypothetical protein
MDDRLKTNEAGSIVSRVYDASGQIAIANEGSPISSCGCWADGDFTGVNETASLISTVYDWENRISQHQSGTMAAAYLYYTDNLKAVENVSGALTTIL